MSSAKRELFKKADAEQAERDVEFLKNHPDLVPEGWDRELWEAYLDLDEEDD